MTMVTEYDWESDTWTHNGDNAARQAWREAVAEIAVKAKQTLPECHGRVDSAVKIVLAGDVELLAEESREMLGVMPLQVFPQPQDPCPDTSA
jgi:hypothetical protein